MFAISTLGMVLTGAGGRGGGNRAAGIDEDRRDYLRYLALLRRRVRRIAAEQRAALEHVHPDPAAWPAVLAAGRLWERAAGRSGLRAAADRSRRPVAGHPADRPADRSGRGHRADHCARAAPVPARRTPWCPICPMAAVAAGQRHRCGSSRTVPAGEPPPARWPARSSLQYALLHSPADARLAVVAPPGLAPDWDWVELAAAHRAPRACGTRPGPVRMVAGVADEVRRWWAAELAGRPAGPGRGRAAPADRRRRGRGRAGPWAGVPGSPCCGSGRRPAGARVRRSSGCCVGPGRLGRGGDGDGRRSGSGDRTGRAWPRPRPAPAGWPASGRPAPRPAGRRAVGPGARAARAAGAAAGPGRDRRAARPLVASRTPTGCGCRSASTTRARR